MAHYPDTPGHGQDTKAENTGWCPEDTTHNPNALHNTEDTGRRQTNLPETSDVPEA